MLTQVLVASVPIQLPANVTGKAKGDGSCIYTLGELKKLLAPGSWLQLSLVLEVVPIARGKWYAEDLYLILSLISN